MLSIRRREFIGLLGSAAAWPFASRAQQQGVALVGYLAPEAPDRYAIRLNAFKQGLAEAGYVEARNIGIDYRWADSQMDRLPALAAELVQRRVAVVAAVGGAAVGVAAKAATSTIPIVFETGADPVAVGLVRSLSHPDGNITGVTSLNFEVGPKRVEILHELVPQARILGFVLNPTDQVNAKLQAEEAQGVAKKFGKEFHVLHATTDRDLDKIFAASAQMQIGAMVFAAHPFFASRAERLAALAMRYTMPAIHQDRAFAAAGGLVSYGGSVTESHRQAGIYTGRILNGEKPADLPVQQITKVELTIKLKTARAFGLAVSLPLSGRADEVIE